MTYGDTPSLACGLATQPISVFITIHLHTQSATPWIFGFASQVLDTFQAPSCIGAGHPSTPGDAAKRGSKSVAYLPCLAVHFSREEPCSLVDLIALLCVLFLYLTRAPVSSLQLDPPSKGKVARRAALPSCVRVKLALRPATHQCFRSLRLLLSFEPS